MTSRIEALIPSPAPERIDAFEQLVRRIVDCLDSCGECGALIAEVDALAGLQGYDVVTFTDLHSWTSEREFAELAAMGLPPSILDLDVQDVADCIDIIASAVEPSSSFCLGMLKRSFPNVPVSGMIFWPEAEISQADLAAEIVRLAKKPVPRLPHGGVDGSQVERS